MQIRPSGGLSQREIVEIMNRRRNDASLVAHLPRVAGPHGEVRVTTRDYSITKPEDPDDKA